MTREQKDAVRGALRQYGRGAEKVRPRAWAGVIEEVLRYYDRADRTCARLLRLRYIEGKSEGEVIPMLYIGRSTYYNKDLEALSTLAIAAAKKGLL